MTPLRHQMIEAMSLRGFSPRTHESYLCAVTQLAGYYHRSPDRLTLAELQVYFKYLTLERKLSPATCRLYLNAVRFFYLKVLGWQHFDVPLIVPKRPQKIPELLNRDEVARILQATLNDRHRMLLSLCYGCGLRVSELIVVQIRDIDGERQVLRVEQGKGARDRYVLLAPTLLSALRDYWHRQRPAHWLFPTPQHPERHIALSSAQRAFLAAKRRAGIDKRGGIHALRHAYATHQLEQGLPVHQLQHLLGHRNLQSTLRYVHWVPAKGDGEHGHADLLSGIEASREL